MVFLDNNTDGLTFIDFIYNIYYEICNDGKRSIETIDGAHLFDDDQEDTNDKVAEDQFITDKRYQRMIILDDLVAVYNYLQEPFTVYTEGIVFGERFLCRGSSFTEKNPPIDGKVSNPFNILTDHCKEKRNRGSWAMWRKKTTEYRDGELKNIIYTKLSQLNFFFVVTINRDRVLQKLPFACVVSRKYATVANSLMRVSLRDPNYIPIMLF